MFKIIIDDKDNYDYDLRVVSRPSVPVTNYEYDEVKISNRGPIYTIAHIPDKVISVDFNFVEKECFGHAIRSVNAWFLNAKKLSFSDDIGVYFRVKKVNISDIERELRVLGKFTVEFTVEPFSYSCDGESQISFDKTHLVSNSITLYNFGTTEALPLIKLHGNGKLSMTINGSTTTVDNVVDYVSLDCETLCCFKDNVNMNKNMTGDFQTFNVGDVVITFSETVESVEIVPRWRYL